MQPGFQVKGKLQRPSGLPVFFLLSPALRAAADEGRLRGMADKNFLPAADPIPLPFHRFHGLSQIQPSFICRDLSVRRLQNRFQRHDPAVVPLSEGQMEFCQRKIGLKPSALHLIVDDVIGLLHPSRKRQPPGLLHLLVMLRIGAEALASGPERIVIDVDRLLRSPSRYGQSERTVSQKMRVRKFFRRPVFP